MNTPTEKTLNSKEKEQKLNNYWKNLELELNKKTFNPETIEKLSLQNNEGWTAFHYLASKNKLNQLPTEILTNNNCCKNNKHKITPLHISFKLGYTTQIPHNIIDIEALTAKNENGDTPLHLLSEVINNSTEPQNLINEINPEWYNPNTIKIKNHNGKTPWDIIKTDTQIKLLRVLIDHRFNIKNHNFNNSLKFIN